MKTILAATDFTGAAQNACIYAASLARQFNARLILFSAYETVPFPSTEVPVTIPVDDLKANAESGLYKAEKEIRLAFKDVVLETMCSEGDAVNQILNAAGETGADIIVTGMKNSGKSFRKLFGSTVTALARKAALPVIVVPEDADFVKLDSIALANDYDAQSKTDPHLLDMLVELGRRFSSKLYLVRIVRSNFQQSYEIFNRPLRLMSMVHSLEPVYECIQGANEERALQEFVRKHDIDMLVLLPHHHSVADRWLAKSTTRTMIFECRVPLLILPGLRIQEEN